MSLILAKILGLYFLAIGLAFFLNPESFRKIYPQVKKDPNFLLMGGILALLIGATVISIHNIWVLDWPVVITVLGWWSLIKGFGLLAYPEFINLFSFIENRSTIFYRILSLVYILLGAFLTFKGWA